MMSLFAGPKGEDDWGKMVPAGWPNPLCFDDINASGGGSWQTKRN
jgi:hypothetical protein